MSKAIFRFCAIAGLVLGSVAVLSAQPRVVSKFGAARVAGRDVIVHMWVVVPPGLDENEVALEALRGQGARPFQGDEFSTTGLVWDVFSDGIPGNDIVTEYYNSQNDPTSGGAGLQALLNKQATWTNEPTSSFAFFFGGSTTRCPSLVQECPGAQAFDGNNDVGWLALGGCCTLAVAWYGTSIDEADIALNTNFPWATDGVNHYDVETVMLHENGHVLGLGHSNVPGAVMQPSYGGVRQSLHQDDIDGVSFLYPGSTGCISSEAGFCSDEDDNDCDGPIDCGDTDCRDCGNNVAEDCELCDGSDLVGATCESLGYQSGTLGCNTTCDGFVTSGCTPCAASETSCTDGIDNDCGGGTDCSDSDCDGDLACQASCFLGQPGDTCSSNGDCCSNKCKGKGGQKTCKGDFACTPTAGSETSCSGGVDEDCDGLVDCADSDCSFDAACQSDGCVNPGGFPAGASCTSAGECCSDKCKGPSGNKSCKG